MIVDVVASAKPEVHSLDLSIQTSEMTITVSAGSFTYERQTYTLDDDASYVVPPTTEEHVIIGFLAKNTSSGEVDLLIKDEIAGDFTPSVDAPSHDIITMIFRLNVLPETTSLDDVNVYVHRFRLPPVEPTEPPGGE